MKKLKLGELLLNRGFVSSIDDAKRIIMANEVLVNDEPIDKPGTLCDAKSRIRIKNKRAFVSRGGDKLFSFFNDVQFDVSNKACIDVGMSTGGFTDVLLRSGASHVLGIDVGYGILDYQLRKNTKVSLLERTNAREVTKKEVSDALGKFYLIPGDIQCVVMDVAFISVFKILPNLISIFNKNVDYIILIKPQFECEKHLIETGGVITNIDSINETLKRVEHQFDHLSFRIQHHSASKFKGAKGNQEFFYYVNLD